MATVDRQNTRSIPMAQATVLLRLSMAASQSKRRETNNMMSTDIGIENDTATVEVATSTNGGTMVSSQDNNNNQCTSQPINMNNIQYTPELLARYIHYYKTGQDINNPKISSTTTSTTNTTEQPPKKKKKRNKKLKHIPPHQLSTRRTIQNCCKTSNLSLALITFYNALNDLIYIDGSVFYQLLNLCESGGDGSKGRGDSSGDMRKRVHVGTPKNSKRDDKEKVQDADTANGSSSDITEATDSNSSPIKITLQQRIQHATTIHKLLSSLQIPLIEQAYTALIRLSVRNNNYKQAEEYLKEAESTQQCKVKLRLYSTLLRGYCGDIPSSSSTSDDDDSNDDFSSKDEKQENKYNNKPTKEGLIKALATWKRLYDNSGGMSTGHPNYAKLNSNGKKSNNKLVDAADNKSSSDTGTNDKKDNKEKQQQQQETISLFGEGISPKITLSEIEYTSLLKAATYLHDGKVIHRILSNVANEVQVPGMECRDAIVNRFKSDTNAKEKADDDIAESQSALDEVTLPPSEVDLTTFDSVTNGSRWSVYNNCSIDTTTGQLTLPNTTNTTPSEVCNDEDGSQHTNLMYKLKPVELSTKSWKSMTNMNRTIVLNGSITGNVSKFQGGGKGKKRSRGSNNNNGGMSEVHGTNSNDRKSKSWTVKDNNSSTSTADEKKKDKPQSNWRINAWNNFEKFIEEHPPYNVVIDGANVGYFNQSFQNAPKHVDYHQIDHLLRHLLENNPNQQQQDHIILFLHERHFTSKIVPQYANEIISKWDSNVAPYNKLTVYRTPSGMNDDWFWMHAALYNGGSSTSSSSSLSPSSSGVMAITNDEMRDHHFQMSCNQAFVRWKERHQIYFDFGLWNKELNRRDVILKYPMVYSRRMQWIENEVGEKGGGKAFVIPLPKKGDEGRFVDGIHVADEGVPEEETYVIICSNP